MKQTQLYKEAIVASLLVILVDILISFVPWKFELIKPIKQGFNDFNVYDLRYSGFDSAVTRKDTDITLLEIGDTRDEIAQEISRVAAMKPRLVGVDAIFYSPSASAFDDSCLTAAMQAVRHLVLACNYVDTPTARFQRSFLEKNLPGATDGFYNFVEGQEDIRRHVAPFLQVDGQYYPSLPARMLQELSPKDYDKLLGRGHRFEMINFFGNLDHYNVISLRRLLHPMNEEDLSSYFRDKVVLIGYFKEESPLVLQDMHFTPMNPKRGGKSYPDTYGVVIQANVLEMMMKGQYIHELPPWGVYVGTFVIIFCINLFYIRRMTHKGGHNRLLLFLLQFILAIGLLYLALLLFDWFNFAFDPMPLLIAVVLSVEIFWLYEWLAHQLNKHFKYETFLADATRPAY